MGLLASRVRDTVFPIRTAPLRLLRYVWDSMGFFHMHLLTFVIMTLIGGLIIFLIELGNTGASFVDAWFMATSAVCVTGLSTLDTSKLRLGSQIVMLIWIVLGGSVITSAAPVFIRWYFFRRFANKAQENCKIKFPVARALVGLSRQEYRALNKLLFLIPLYVFFFCFLGGMVLFIYLWAEPTAYKLVQDRGLSYHWFAMFHAISAFNNAGFSLFSENLIPFMQSAGFLVILMFLIVAGNVGFPIILRGFITLFYRLARPSQRKVFKFLLDHPRLCFVYLFPLSQTFWLLAVLLGFTCIQWFLELILDWGAEHFSNIEGASRVFIFLFQAISTRTAGFNAFDLSLSSPAVQVLYMVMMYISSYPVALSARTSTIDKKALQPEDEEDRVYHIRESSGSTKNNVRYQAKNLIFRDISYLIFGLMIISIAEDEKLTTDPGFSLFKILFELVSAYGTVGLTLGYPGSAVSLSGSMHPVSKVVVIIVMLLGRHRGLPLSIDHAISYRSAIAVEIMEEQQMQPARKRNTIRNDGLAESEDFPARDTQTIEEEMQRQIMASPGQTRRITVDIADLDRNKRNRRDSF